jgi:hypothetical protein
MPHGGILLCFTPRANGPNRGNCELWPVNWLRLPPDKPGDVTDIASKTSIQDGVVWPHVLQDMNLLQHLLQFWAHITVINTCGTLASVLNLNPPFLPGNGLEVLETARMEDVKSCDIIFSNIEIASDNT